MGTVNKKSSFDNVIKASQLKQTLIDEFLELEDILRDHAGPLATNCVIGSKWRQHNDVDEFTKDGIKIFRHLIVSEEVAARFAARMARFVGICVDHRCHDGTTTSMLLFCHLARVALSKIDTDLNGSQMYAWWKTLEASLKLCLDQLDTIKITDQDLYELAGQFGIDTTIDDVRYAMAYHMSMISSKGDMDLSTKIATMVRATPQKINGMFNNQPLAVETPDRYTLKEQEYDIAITGDLGDFRYLNHKSDTQYLSNEAVVFVTGNEITKGGFESMFLTAFISKLPRERQNLADFGTTKGWEEYHEERKPLVILSPALQDPELIGLILEFNKDNPTNPIIYFNYHCHRRMRSNLNKTLHYMAGKPLFSEATGSGAHTSLLGLEGGPIKVHILGTTMTISGVYQKDGGVFHPFYRDPDLSESYTRYRLETEEVIEFAQKNITNPGLDRDELNYLIMLYRALTCQKIFDIEVGGMAHEQKANSTVYEDAAGAALSAITEGVVLGGYGHLARFVGNLDGDVNAHIGLALLDVIADTMRVDRGFISSLASELDTKWSYIVAEPSKFINHENYADYVSRDVLDADKLKEFLSCDGNKPILLQAWAGYHEQFKRFVDMLPKLANTTHLADMRVNDVDAVR